MNPGAVGELWLPTGHLESWGLHVEKKPLADAGLFIKPAGWKLTWHTTETPENWIRTGVRNWASGVTGTPHFIIGLEDGRDDYTVIQMIDLIHAAKTLEHPSGTKETNKARSVQVEVCGYAKNAQDWPERKYRALAALSCLIEHRVPIPRNAPRPFMGTANNRYSQSGWILAEGHNGHQHAASQPQGHWDPGRLRIAHLFDLMKEVDH